MVKDIAVISTYLYWRIFLSANKKWLFCLHVPITLRYYGTMLDGPLDLKKSNFRPNWKFEHFAGPLGFNEYTSVLKS